MSISPPIRRLSTASSSSKREEDLINAYEAEEERIINVLSRKLEKVCTPNLGLTCLDVETNDLICYPFLCAHFRPYHLSLFRRDEQLQEEKIELENVLEAESESHVNRLSRELSALRLAQQLAQAQSQNVNNHVNGEQSTARVTTPHANGVTTRIANLMTDPLAPNSEVMLEAMRRENEQLRNRLVDTEREYIRVMRLNEIYREELIDHRRRVSTLFMKITS